MQSSLQRYQAKFGPVSGNVIKAATRLAMWPWADPILDKAVEAGKPIEDWKAFEAELLKQQAVLAKAQ